MLRMRNKKTKTTEDTEIYREKFTENTEKICANLCNLWFLSLASFTFLGALGVLIHRFTQIYTDFREHPQILNR